MDSAQLLREIGTRLYIKRREKGYTQEKLAELTDVTPQTISYAEQGRKAMRAENIVKVCNALNISADYLLMGKESNTSFEVLEEQIKSLTNEQQIYIKLILNSCINLCKEKSDAI